MSAAGQIEIAVPAAARLGQAPTWDPSSDSLLWVDVLTSTAHRFTPGGKDHTMQTPQLVSAAKPRSHGGLLFHLSEGIALFDAHGEQRTWLAYWGREGFRGGETAVDPRGRLWANTIRHDESGGGWLVRVAPNGKAAVVLDTVGAGNGLAWNAEGTRMYFADSKTRRVDVLDFDPPTGDATARREFCSITAGHPAGLCVDVDGGVWVTVRDRGELHRYTSEGDLDRTIALPVQRPTGCCFGGPSLDDLYVTSAREGVAAPHDTDGALLVLPQLGPGPRTTSFAG